MRKLANKNVILIPIFAGIFFAADDQTVIVTILPQIMSDLMVEVTELDKAMWTVTGYLLGYVSVMPIMGRVSDIYGRKFIYVVSMSVFMLGSVGTGLTNSMGFLESYAYHDSTLIRSCVSGILEITTSLDWIIGARIIQAVGAGALIPITIAIISDIYSGNERAIPLGLTGAAAEAGAVTGPLWGGIITQFFSWQWVFWLNIPIGLLVIAGILFLVPNSKGTTHKIDYLGSAVIVAAICFITLGCSQSGSNTPFLVIFISIGVSLLIGYYLLSKLNDNSVVPIELFKNIQFLAANTLHLFYGATLIISMVTIPLMVNTVLSGTSLEGGLILMRMTIAIPVGAVMGGWLSKHYDLRIPAISGLIFCFVALLFMSRWNELIGDPLMSYHLLVAGFGFGLTIAPITTSAINSSSKRYQGSAAGIISSSRFLGMTFGIAALSAWGSQRFQDLLLSIDLKIPGTGVLGNSTSEFENQLIQAGINLFHDFFMIGSVLCLIGIFPCLFLVKTRMAKDPWA
ncbi:MAG: MFS family permease [Chloroflexi bacterium]|jgi:MFS family permease|nr:MAG: MFS family permease [Chloroflexota bacterium]